MITKKQFKLFCDEHSKWMKRFGLFPWKVSYHLAEPSREFRGAWNIIEFENQLCEVYLDKYYKKEPFEKTLESALRETAKHEALHVLVAPVYLRGGYRFVDEKEYSMANEDLIRRLTDLIKD